MQNLLGGKEDEVFPLLRDAALKLVAAGADAICLGSTTMHQAVGYLKEHLPVPVIDPGR
ncbi:aspartate/glutamate racemase family protein [Streptomyces sp. INA 01156]